MRIIVWALWLLLFLVFFGFALNNTTPTDLRFFGGFVWNAPLVAILLAFFFGGVALGLVAMLPAWLRLRLQIRRMKKNQAREAKLAPDTVMRTAAKAEEIQAVAQGARTTS